MFRPTEKSGEQNPETDWEKASLGKRVEAPERFAKLEGEKHRKALNGTAAMMRNCQ